MVLAVCGCRTVEEPPRTILVREGSVQGAVVGDPVSGPRYGAVLIGSTGPGDVVFFATRIQARFGKGITWDEWDVVALAGAGCDRRFGQYHCRELVLQGGIAANERVRNASPRLRPQWGPQR